MPHKRPVPPSLGKGHRSFSKFSPPVYDLHGSDSTVLVDFDVELKALEESARSPNPVHVGNPVCRHFSLRDLYRRLPVGQIGRAQQHRPQRELTNRFQAPTARRAFTAAPTIARSVLLEMISNKLPCSGVIFTIS